MLADAFLEPMVGYINELGWDVYSFDHEGGDGQYEFDFGYTDALADGRPDADLPADGQARRPHARLLRLVHAQAVPGGVRLRRAPQRQPGRHRDRPEPVRRRDRGRPGPPTAAREQAYSTVAYQFTAGVLAHAGALMAVLSPTVNSYKRLMPRGLMQEISWAPVFQAWGYNNRTLMCRLPMNRRCLEVRTADSAVNFYLGSALVLAAGLDGIRRELKPGDPVNIDTYKVTPSRSGRGRACSGCRGRWARRSSAFEQSEFACEVLGERAARVLRGAQAGRVAGVQHGRQASGSRPGTCGCGERGHAVSDTQVRLGAAIGKANAEAVGADDRRRARCWSTCSRPARRSPA